MKKLKNTKKVTLATLKSFANRNKDHLYYRELSSFDGMTDCVEFVKMNWKETKVIEDKGYYRTGIQGIYTVGNSRDYFEIYEDNIFYGIEVTNCCGSSILAVKKQTIEKVEYIDFEKELLSN